MQGADGEDQPIRFQAQADVEPLGGGAAQSAPAHGRLHRQLSTFGVLLLTLSCLSPVFSIYGVGSDVLQHAGSGAAGLFLFGIGAALVWVLVYAELGAAFPYAGGDYVGVGAILGPWAGFVTLVLWAATSGPSVAFEAQIMATYTHQLAPAIPEAVVTYGAVAAGLLIALLAVRTSALVTGLFLAIEMVAVLALIFGGLAHPVRGLGAAIVHPMVLGGGGLMVPATVAVMALSAISAVYGTVGGNQAIGFGEELKDPHRRMGRVIVLAGLIGAVTTALPVIAVVLGARDLPAIIKSPAPFTAFIASVAGPLAGRALGAGVALAIFNALIAQIMFSARLFFSLGRDAVLPPAMNRFLAGVHERSGAPRAASWVVGIFSALCCLLDSHTLLIFNTGLVVYAWPLVCLAVIIGRRRGQTGAAGFWRAPWFPLAPAAGLAMAAVFAVSDLADPDAGRPGLLVLGVIVAVAVIWHHLVLRRRPGGWAPRLG